MPRGKKAAADAAANRESPIIVAGTGPAGLIAALGLAGAGFDVELAGPLPRRDDRRTTALMMPALRFFERIELRHKIEEFGAPLRTMRIVDATARLIRSPTVTFRAAEIGEDFFGINLPNTELNRVLVEAAETDTRIRWSQSLVARWEVGDDAVRAELEDDSAVTAKLAVAADGRLSPAREAAGIRTTSHDWKQSAFVVTFAHTRPHVFTSTEFHTESGPFTQVPLPGDRSSLVWVVRPETAVDLLALPDADLSRRIEDGMQSMLGRVSVENGRQVYPLAATLALSHARSRVALVGEAAHVFPPIGAQGLNLGIRDVADLVDAVAKHPDDPGSPAALSAYASRRRPDIFARTGAVNVLNQSLLSDFLPAQLVRSSVLGALNALSPLRSFFMREGLQTGSGFRAFGSAVREQIRR